MLIVVPDKILSRVHMLVMTIRCLLSKSAEQGFFRMATFGRCDCLFFHILQLFCQSLSHFPKVVILKNPCSADYDNILSLWEIYIHADRTEMTVTIEIRSRSILPTVPSVSNNINNIISSSINRNISSDTSNGITNNITSNISNY